MIFIDGSNFYFKLKDLKLHQQLDFDFTAFFQLLLGEAKLSQVTYYIGKVRTDGTEKTQKLLTDQQKLFEYLKKHQIKYRLGYLLKSKGVMHEKGVDVQIAVDMLVATYEDKAERLLIVSSDTDLIPAIKKARQKGKQVEYIGFAHQPSWALMKECQTSKLLTREEIAPLIKKTQGGQKQKNLQTLSRAL